MIKRVLYFIESPFDKRDYNRFGVEILQRNGFDVEVWDFTPFLYPQVHERVNVSDPISNSSLRQFVTRREAVAAIRRLNCLCFVISFIVYRYETFSIYRAMSQNKLQYCVTALNIIPTSRRKRTAKELVRKLGNSSVLKLFKAAFRHVPFESVGIRSATILLAGGAHAKYSSHLVNKTTKINWAHTLDYDIYLTEKQKPVNVNANMGVFLDEFLPFHPDYLFSGVAAPCTPEEYYRRIRELFSTLEREFGKRVVIAAHPRSRYEHLPDYFGGRRVIRGTTAQLVRETGFTITHGSTSLNFVVLFGKPALFVTTNRLQQSPTKGRQLMAMANALNKTPINLDRPLDIDWEKELTVDHSAYLAYRQAYIKTNGSPEKAAWQILADSVKRLGS